MIHPSQRNFSLLFLGVFMASLSDFSVDQIVRGKVAGTFMIIGFTQIGGEWAAVLKEVHPVTLKPARGQLALPLDCIVAA